ncbi:Protein DOWNY MILDEW RESISTANCE 6 [Linum grandiflorum]
MDTKVLSTGIPFTTLPESYIRPESDRPRLSQVLHSLDIPVIDLSIPDRSLLVRQIEDACTNFGFFQVINHGVGLEAKEEMLRVATEFFELPVEEKMKIYSDDPSKTMRLSTSFNVKKEKVHNWRDYLRLHCHPLPKYAPEWPSNPPSFRGC